MSNNKNKNKNKQAQTQTWFHKKDLGNQSTDSFHFKQLQTYRQLAIDYESQKNIKQYCSYWIKDLAQFRIRYESLSDIQQQNIQGWLKLAFDEIKLSQRTLEADIIKRFLEKINETKKKKVQNLSKMQANVQQKHSNKIFCRKVFDQIFLVKKQGYVLMLYVQKIFTCLLKIKQITYPQSHSSQYQKNRSQSLQFQNQQYAAAAGEQESQTLLIKQNN